MKKIIMIQDWINAAVFGAVGNSTTLNIVVNGVTRATLTATQSSINKGYYRFSDWSLNASGLSSISINITGIGIDSGAEVNFNGGIVASVDEFTTSYTLNSTELNAVKAAYISDTVAKSFAGTAELKKIFAGALQVFAKQYLLTISSITGVDSQTINRTASNVDAGTGALANGAIIYLDDTITISATASSGYSAPTVTSPVTVTGNIATSSYITAGSSSLSKTLTGYNSDPLDMGRTPEVWTPPTTIAISAGTFTGKRNTTSYSVGYIIKKGTTTVKSGTASSFTLSAAERTSLSGAGAISVDCSSPTGTFQYTYTAALALTYTT